MGENDAFYAQKGKWGASVSEFDYFAEETPIIANVIAIVIAFIIVIAIIIVLQSTFFIVIGLLKCLLCSHFFEQC